MKRYLLSFAFVLSGLFSFGQKMKSSEAITITTLFYQTGIKDGWYNARVKYTNWSTGTSANYTLSVKVQYNSVTAIDFGNGGSIHSGYNNEGYTYSGGYLSFETDYQGNIVSATATVTTYDNNGTKVYNIRIE